MKPITALVKRGENRFVFAMICIVAMVFCLLETSPAYAAGVGNSSSASFTYAKGTYSSFTEVTSLTSTSNSENTGLVKAYDDGTNLYIWVYTWAKPYLAYGESLDGTVDGDGIPKAGGTINDMGSDGMKITLNGVTDLYTWTVGAGKTRDPEIDCPSWDISNAAGVIQSYVGVMAGPLVYIATIPMGSTTTFNVALTIHHSPPTPTLPISPGTMTLLSHNTINLGDSVTDTVNLTPDYNSIIYEGAGGGLHTTGTTFNVAYPGTHAAGDLLLLQIMVADTSNAPTVGNSFTLLYGPDSDGNARQWIYYKFASGSESGSISVAVSGSSLKLARMFTFRNVASESFTENPSFGVGSTTTVNAQSVTTSGPNRLAISFIFWKGNDADINSITGETGGDWTEVADQTKSPDDGKGGIDLQSAGIASAGIISGGTGTLSKSVTSWGLKAFALIPTIAGYPTGDVSFQVLPPGGSWTTFDTKTISSGSATSSAYTPEGPGIYYFRAVYLGNANHLSSQSGDSDEPLMVTCNVVPETPLGTITASVGMLLALSCTIAVKRRKKT